MHRRDPQTYSRSASSFWHHRLDHRDRRADHHFRGGLQPACHSHYRPCTGDQPDNWARLPNPGG